MEGGRFALLCGQPERGGGRQRGVRGVDPGPLAALGVVVSTGVEGEVIGHHWPMAMVARVLDLPAFGEQSQRRRCWVPRDVSVG